MQQGDLRPAGMRQVTLRVCHSSNAPCVLIPMYGCNAVQAQSRYTAIGHHFCREVCQAIAAGERQVQVADHQVGIIILGGSGQALYGGNTLDLADLRMHICNHHCPQGATLQSQCYMPVSNSVLQCMQGNSALPRRIVQCMMA